MSLIAVLANMKRSLEESQPGKAEQVYIYCTFENVI